MILGQILHSLPSGDQTDEDQLLGLVPLTRAMAVSAELPVANMGSTTRAVRFDIFRYGRFPIPTWISGRSRNPRHGMALILLQIIPRGGAGRFQQDQSFVCSYQEAGLRERLGPREGTE